MGSCLSNHQQLINELNKSENRKILLDFLNANKNDIFSEADVTKEPLPVNTNSNSCSRCKCSCHLSTSQLTCAHANMVHTANQMIETNKNPNEELVFKIISVDNSSSGESQKLKKISFLLNASEHEIYLENLGEQNKDTTAVSFKDVKIDEVNSKKEELLDSSLIYETGIVKANCNAELKANIYQKEHLITDSYFKNQKKMSSTLSAKCESQQQRVDKKQEKQKQHRDLSYFYSQKNDFYDYFNCNENQNLLEKCEKCLKNKKPKPKNYQVDLDHKVQTKSVRNSYSNDLTTQNQRHYHHHHHHNHNYTRSHNEFYHELDTDNLDDYGDLDLNIIGKKSHRDTRFASSPLHSDDICPQNRNSSLETRTLALDHSVFDSRASHLKNGSTDANCHRKNELKQQQKVRIRKAHQQNQHFQGNKTVLSTKSKVANLENCEQDFSSFNVKDKAINIFTGLKGENNLINEENNCESLNSRKEVCSNLKSELDENKDIAIDYSIEPKTTIIQVKHLIYCYQRL